MLLFSAERFIVFILRILQGLARKSPFCKMADESTAHKAASEAAVTKFQLERVLNQGTFSWLSQLSHLLFLLSLFFDTFEKNGSIHNSIESRRKIAKLISS